MIQDHEQISNSRESLDELESDVNKNNKAVETRSKINSLLDRFKEGRLASNKTIDAYKKAMREDPTLEGLEGFYQWISDQWTKANFTLGSLHTKINSGISEKIMSEKDREFLMNNLILTDEHDFVGISEKISEALVGKIDRMKEDRGEYDKLVDHPLIQNTGFLKTDKNTKINIPDLDDFLKLTVPERRKFLNEAKKALPKAEIYAKNQEGIESEGLGKEYTEMLNKAKKEGWIGKSTYEKFMDGFRKIDIDEKKVWIQEMKSGRQMQRYKDLWANIRKTLDGETLKKMEFLREKMGYTELLNEFGAIKDKEGSDITRQYNTKLTELLKKRVISKHTHRAFMQDIKNKSLDEKKRYLESFPVQMRRYEALRVKIDQIKDKGARKALDEMYDKDEFGFSDIQSKYSRLTSTNAEKGSDADNELNVIENKAVRQAVKSGSGILDKTQKIYLVDKLTSFFEGRTSDMEDINTYQKRLQKARKEHRIANIHEIKKHHRFKQEEEVSDKTDCKNDPQDIQADALNNLESKDEIAELDQAEQASEPIVTKDEYRKKLPRRAKTELNRNKTFVKKTFYNESGEKKHVMRAQLNSVDGVRSLNSTALNKQEDNLSVYIWAEKKPYELKLNEIRATVRFLRKNIAKTTNPEQ